METEEKPRKDNSLIAYLKPGMILYSTITSIFYKIEKGVLMKYASYGGADRGWTESAYVGDKRACMKEATDAQLKTMAAEIREMRYARSNG